VVCVSHKTEQDLRLLAGDAPPETFVVHHPLNWDFHPVLAGAGRDVLAARGVHGVQQYLLHIGNNSWYKNRQAAVRIFAELKRTPAFAGVKLVLAGKPWDEPLRALVQASSVSGDVVELQRVSNEELRALYSDAAALLFPSREEGFGWPILEAQACGCPVITTDRAPMTEIAGDAAVLIDPEDPAAAAQTILAQLPRLNELKERGLRNVERFSVGKAMDAYEAVYAQVLARQNAAPGGSRP
jgi:glycosyltransferase involved in cell wall biosynthesis